MRSGCGFRIVVFLQTLDNFLHLNGNCGMVIIGVGRNGMLIVGSDSGCCSLHQNIVAFFGRQLNRSQWRHERRIPACGQDGLGLRVDDSVG